MTLTGARNVSDSHVILFNSFFFLLCFLETTQAAGAGTESSFHNRIRYKYPMETDVPGAFRETTDLQTDRFAEKKNVVCENPFSTECLWACKHTDGGL